jgi:hypothetical protein
MDAKVLRHVPLIRLTFLLFPLGPDPAQMQASKCIGRPCVTQTARELDAQESCRDHWTGSRLLIRYGVDMLHFACVGELQFRVHATAGRGLYEGPIPPPMFTGNKASIHKPRISRTLHIFYIIYHHLQ